MNLRMLSASALTLIATMAAGSADSQTQAFPDLTGLWTHGFSLGFDSPPEGGVGPIHDVKTRAQMRAEGQYLVYDADLTHPALQPWVVEELKRSNEAVKSGHRLPTNQEICFPSGVPGYWTHPLMMQVVQTKDHVVFLHARDHQVRIVPLDKPHLPNPEPSWYGDSVGHFEGDTLVIDTIGLNDKSHLDVFNTPHTTKEHVIERIRIVHDANGAKNLQVRFTVEDPGAFAMPWTGVEIYRAIGTPKVAHDILSSLGLLDEEVCAENNIAIGMPGGYNIPTETLSKFR